MDVFLRFLSGRARGQTKVVSIARGARLRLGRALDSEIWLGPDAVVSSYHAVIENEGGFLVLYDNGSRNGTFLNGRRIDRARVRSGDRFFFGRNGPEVEFVYKEGVEGPPVAFGPPAPPASVRNCGICGAFLGGEQATCHVCRRAVCEAHLDAATGACAACFAAGGHSSRRALGPPGVVVPPPLRPAASDGLTGIFPPLALSPHEADPKTAAPRAAAPIPLVAPRGSGAGGFEAPLPEGSAAAFLAPAAPRPLFGETREEWARSVLAGEGFAVRERIPTDDGTLVFRAERAVFGQKQPLLVKVLARGERDSASEARFIREARLAARLHHPNVLALYDVRASERYLMIIREAPCGRTLGEELRRRGKLDAGFVLAIAAQIARALEHLHGHGIVHRNVSPEAIHIADDGSAKLAELGLVKSIRPEERKADPTACGEILGSLGHIAPEQVIDSAGVDARADIYALGAVMYHAIAGFPPHSGFDRLDLPSRRDVPPAPPLDEAAPGTPAVVVEIVMRALDPWPERRFPDAATMLAAIEGAARALRDKPQPVAVAPPACPAPPSSPPSWATKVTLAEGFAGGFSGTQIVELLQMVEVNRRSGVLEVSGEEGEGSIEFAEGRIAGAAWGGERGIEAAHRVLSIPEGLFRLRFQEVAAPPGAPPISSVLLDHLRRRDETPRGAASSEGSPDPMDRTLRLPPRA